MKHMRRHSRPYSLSSRGWMLGLVAVLAALMAWHALRVSLLSRTLRGERRALEETILKREREIAELKSNIERTESGEGLEIEARSRLNLKKPGEEVLIILSQEATSTTRVETPENGLWATITEWLSFWR